MKLVDLNLLLYAIDEEATQHERARPWLEEVLSSTEDIGFSWIVLLGFVRISTNPVIFERPLSSDEALDYVDGWLSQPSAAVIQPTERHGTHLRELLTSTGTAGNLTTDAHLAALAIEHGGELCSADTDFARFPGLRWYNPLG